MSIPFFSNCASCSTEWVALEPLLDAAISAGVFVNGPIVGHLEQSIAAYTGAPHAIATASGSDALMLALLASDIGPGDEVLVPAYTFVASATSVIHAGAQPVFVDIEPDSYALDLSLAERQLTNRTKAIMPVHLFHQLNNLPALHAFAQRHRLLLVEDSAEAIGMRFEGRSGGTWGDVGVLSFFPAKTLGGLGDAGMVLSNSMEIAERCRQLANHGQVPGASPYTWGVIGHNSRMDDLQAAVLLARLSRLDEQIAQRNRLAAYYDQRLAGIDQVRSPTVTDKRSPPVFYVYVIEALERDALAQFLSNRGIETEIYYPRPVPLQPCFAALGHAESDFPVALKISQAALALPLYPDLSEGHIETVCGAISAFYTRTSPGARRLHTSKVA